MSIHPFKIGLIFAIIVVCSIPFFLKLSAPAQKKEVSSTLTLLEMNFIPCAQPTDISDLSFQRHEEGKLINLALNSLKGKPIILHFWEPWCGACLSEMPDFQKFCKKNKDRFHIICITSKRSSDDVNTAKSYYDKQSFPLMNLSFDNQGVLGQTFRVRAFPCTLFFNAQGKEIGRIVGAVEWSGEEGDVLLKYLSA